jgi:hypothetical protein
VGIFVGSKQETDVIQNQNHITYWYLSAMNFDGAYALTQFSSNIPIKTKYNRRSYED